MNRISVLKGAVGGLVLAGIGFALYPMLASLRPSDKAVHDQGSIPLSALKPSSLSIAERLPKHSFIAVFQDNKRQIQLLDLFWHSNIDAYEIPPEWLVCNELEIRNELIHCVGPFGSYEWDLNGKSSNNDIADLELFPGFKRGSDIVWSAPTRLRK